MHTQLVLIVLSVFLAFAYVGPSTAEPITVGYSGVIDTVDDPNGVVPGLSEGMSFQGSYTLDPDLFTTATFSGFTGLWVHTPGPGVINVDIGGNVFSRSVESLRIGNDVITSVGQLDWWGIQRPLVNPTPAVGIDITDTTQTRLSDPMQVFVNTSLLGWTQAGMALSVDDPTAPTGT